MRASRRIVAVLATAVAVGSRPTSAQNTPVSLSLSRPDWISGDGFSLLSNIRVLSSGMVLVIDGQELEVQLLDASGKTVRQVGRKGSGPSEYTMPTALIALPNDSTFLVDRDARRYLIIDPRGQITKTEPFPTALGAAADVMVGADAKGRLLLGVKTVTDLGEASPEQPIGRWTRGANNFETVATFTAERPDAYPVTLPIPGAKDFAFRSRQVFAAVNDWATGSSGRIAIIHAAPYRVDWVELNGTTTAGTAVPVNRIPVTELDRKQFEPKGPPYVRHYAEVKSPFVDAAVLVDNRDNVWVPRSEAAEFKNRRWDVFSPTGKLRGTVLVPNGRMLMAVTEKHVYVRYTDSDGLQWLERYAR